MLNYQNYLLMPWLKLASCLTDGIRLIGNVESADGRDEDREADLQSWVLMGIALRCCFEKGAPRRMRFFSRLRISG